MSNSGISTYASVTAANANPEFTNLNSGNRI